MTDDETAELKRRVCAAVDERCETLLAVSHDIHAEPELCFEERAAHDLLVGVLRDEGLDVTPHAYRLETAFEATAGKSGPTVAICCEYDALPDIGHACGHNIIAAAGLGAALAVAPIANEAGGRLRVLGTPAEEGGGGKVFMCDRGALDDVDAALMIHPADHDLTKMQTIAMQELNVLYTGKAAHAAAAPHEGRNALDAAVLGYNAVAALRQHIKPDERIHGVFTDGGGKANVVPAHAATSWYVRSPTIDGLEALKERVVTALRGASDATGCVMEHAWKEPAYADMIDDESILAAYVENASKIGRVVEVPDQATSVTGSTDMGNISHVVPSIHPMIKAAPEGTPIHTPAFAEAAASAIGDDAVLDGAKAIAMTVIDLWRTNATH